MRSLLVLIMLLAFPALAEARTVCGPAKAKTLASNGQARLYESRARTYGCAGGHRRVAFGAVAKARLAGRFAAVVRGDRVEVYDLRRRKRTVRGGSAERVHALRLVADGTAAWIAGDGDGRSVLVNDTPYARDAAIDRAFLGLAGGVLLFRRGDGYETRGLHDDDGSNAGASLARIGAVRLEASLGIVYARGAGGRRKRLDEAYRDDSSSVGGGLDRVLVAGTAVAGRSNGYGVGGDATGGAVRVLDVAKPSARTVCATPRVVGDFVVTRSGHVACVVEEGLQYLIESDGLVIDRFDFPTGLAIRDDKLTWQRDGQASTGPLPGTVVCGPKAATTLGQSPEARIYRRGGAAEACDVASGSTLGLGDATRVLETILAGRYAALRRGDGGAETLTAYDLREAQAISAPARASKMTAIALGDSGIGAYVSPEGAGDTINGTYAGTARPSRFVVRVLDSLVVWESGRHVHLRRAIDTPVYDGRAWAIPNAFLMHVAQGQLVIGVPASPTSKVLGPIPAGCADPAGCTGGVTTVGYGGGTVGALERGVLTIHDPGGTTRQPCPPPVHAFEIDDTGAVTCS